MAAILRKAKRLLDDPVLCRWLLGRLLRRLPAPEFYCAHRPPYLHIPGDEDASPPQGPVFSGGALNSPLALALPGENLVLAPDASLAELLAAAPPDPETVSALHRFAWLPLAGPGADPAWVAALWQVWCEHYATPDASPVWEAYTAGERLINVLDFARRHGFPGPQARTVAVLAGHGRGILDRLEYYGETGTCNHLANNGRALWRLGLALEMPALAEAGSRILLAEAQRLFLPSGMLREESTHYHLLYVRNYADAWLAARRHGRPEAAQLQALLARLFAVVPRLVLPGGMPLMGDISPDSPPEFLAGLLPGAAMDQGWTAWLDEDERLALAAMRDSASPVDGAALASDGWLRADFGDWAGLWHTAPGGWSLPTGHGHGDLAAPELHYRGVPLFIDPGRGAYGDSGAAGLYRSAQVHGGLQVDDAEPYPTNKPYYGEDFRNRVAGVGPHLRREDHAVVIRHGGFARLRGIGTAERRWQFAGNSLEIADRIEGAGRHAMVSRLVTPWPVTVSGNRAVIQAGGFEVTVTASAPLTLRPVTRWTAYGRGEPATAIECRAAAALPWVAVQRVDIA